MSKVVEMTKVDDRHVACDGGDGSLGHPRVFLAIDDTDQIACPYCGHLFIFDPENADTDQ